ncbi:DNA polymerase III subunit alpha [Phaeovibrio sulfidiphilus]|uniref:DNA polymerase III subunit alpha n=1 Tax=Phaeovibrio sulfidiphilus TaxID=1220600 RepID=A0A8J6YW58_9PROT|nr:DNA polymerase III subunit alpha [Phaeovibrio sulfidiphilus]MBE1236807.1 DNA polymerase III subunit alpha [Phaeovibrio sulfidiphilus]
MTATPSPAEETPQLPAVQVPEGSFVHLRVHTALSLSEGAIGIRQLADACRADGMPAVAITDTGNLFGALEFSIAAQDRGVQPVVGIQLAVRNEDTRESGFGASREVRDPDPDTLVLLAQNETGLGNLTRLSSKAFLESARTELPQVRLADIEALSEGLILMTGGVRGPLGRLLLAGRFDEAEAHLLRLKEVFGDRLYVEIQRHDTDEENRIEPRLIDLAYAHDLPLVATNDAFFLKRQQFEAHDVLICLSQKTVLDDPDRRCLTPEHYLKSAAEMRALFADLPEACDNTLVIARRCAVRSPKRKPILPHGPGAGEGMSEGDALRKLARDGLDRRLETEVYTPDMDEAARSEVAAPYRERLDFEIDVIIRMGFPGYFLIVADFIQWAKGKGIPVGPGRGSGAGSVVAWALTITNLNPLRYALLFERFLNPERVSMPDFDIDFCQERRGEVIAYVQERYGTDRVAQIITFGKLQARAVLRSVGRVMQMPLGKVNAICKLVPAPPGKTVMLADAIREEERLRALRDEDPEVAKLLEIGQELEGLYSHASTHAAGVVIGDRPLVDLVPLYRDPNSDMPVTQFNMKWVEQAGLVKFDFLGLKTLSVVATAASLLKRRGIEVDPDTIPLDDRPAYELMSRGETAGVFQLESTGMRDVLKGLKPDTIEDIVAIVALYRPGPMENIPSYIRRKNGEEEVIYMHPSLEPILKETYGIMIYQEQVMQAAQIMAGYSLGGADLLRRAMGKKIKAEMDEQRALFVTGATARGTSQSKANEVFDQMAKFAEYGFNKSHAAAYAIVAYQTAYLKANYPVEFMAATMTFDLNNTDRLAASKMELKRLGIEVLGPDVNRSEATFCPEDGAVRYALGAIKNVGLAAMRDLVAERQENGPFRSLEDFVHRMDLKAVNKRMLENLIKAGALDSLHPDRRSLLDGVELLMRHAQLAGETRSSSQSSLFGDGEDSLPPLNLPKARPWSEMERLSHERDAIGFYLSAHPLDIYADSLERLEVIPLAYLAGHVRSGGSSARVPVAVVPGAKKERISEKSKSRYAFVEISDATAMLETMVFSEQLAASRELLESGQPLFMTVSVRMDSDEIRLSASHIEPLDNAIAKAVQRVRITLGPEISVGELREVLERDGRGKRQITLCLTREERDVDIRLKSGYAVRGETISRLRTLPGILAVREV